MTMKSFHVAAFDSGVGGLTALAPFLKKYPGASLHYLGDLANLPYGSKSAKRVEQLLEAHVRYLLDSKTFAQKPDLLVIACNTASAHALKIAQKLAKEVGIPCVGVIEGPCNMALHLNPKRIVVLATQATVSSRAYEKSLREQKFAGEVLEIACPLFVPLVEESILKGPAVDWVVGHYLDNVVQPGDAVILGCTHYPFLIEAFTQRFPDCRFIQAGEALLNHMRPGHDIPAQAANIDLVFTDTLQDSQKITRFMKQLGLADRKFSETSIAPLI